MSRSLPTKPKKQNVSRGVLFVHEYQISTYVIKGAPFTGVQDISMMFTFLGRYTKSPPDEAIVTKSAFRFMDGIKFLRELALTIKADLERMENEIGAEPTEEQLEAKGLVTAYLNSNIELADEMLKIADGMHVMREVVSESED